MTRLWNRQGKIVSAVTDEVVKSIEAADGLAMIRVRGLKVIITNGTAQFRWRWVDGGTQYHDLTDALGTGTFDLPFLQSFGKYDAIGANDEGNTANLVVTTTGGTVDVRYWAWGDIIPATT